MADESADGVVGQIKEAAFLVRDYAKQETVDPLKQVGKYLAFGVVGSLLLAFGVMFLSVAVLRLLQEQTGDTFDGRLTFFPYLIAFVTLVILTGLSFLAARRSN